MLAEGMIMDLQLTGKRALITGSSSGIGEAIAKSLASEGVAVAIHGRNEARVKQVAQEIEAQGHQAVCVLGDISDDVQANQVSDTTLKLLGGIDILVNNAGGSGEKKLWDQTTPDDWAELYSQNLLTIVRMVHRLVPPMRNSGWGRVVNISSGAGVLPAATGADYSAAKAAVNNLTVSLSKEVGKDGVTVNAILPGPILTPKLESVFRRMAHERGWVEEGQDSWTEIEKAVVKNAFSMSLPRVGQAEEVASAVTFLCSPLAGFITGTNLRIDGGTVPTV